MREYHGKSRTREYGVWNTMIARCHNPNAVGYPHYGAKGVSVCDRWRESFSAFIADMGPKPSPRHELDRVDGTRGYEPGNVRWASPVEQANNKWTVRKVTFGGETLSIADWARRLGVSRRLLYKRIATLGWPLDRALTTTLTDQGHYVEFGGHRRNLGEWARVTGIKRLTIAYRLGKGWSVERALTTPVR